MKKRKMILISLILSLSICLLLIVSIAVFFLSCTTQKPPMQLPKDATEIKYKAKSYPGIGYEEYLRFNIPIEKCISVAENILKNHSKKNVEIIVKKLDNYDLSNREGPSWFKDNIIENGEMLYLKNSPPGGPVVLVDTKKGIIYYSLTD